VAALLVLLRQNPEGVTALQALREIGSFRLAARVWELRDAGHHIETDIVTVNGKRIARYRLVEPVGQVALW
jgi:hypothetical protein